VQNTVDKTEIVLGFKRDYKLKPRMISLATNQKHFALLVFYDQTRIDKK